MSSRTAARRAGAPLFAVLLLTSGLIGLPALAQPVPTTPESAQPAGDKPANADIVITGSRISRRDFQSDSPISTVSSAAIAAAGQPSLDKAIGELPQFSGHVSAPIPRSTGTSTMSI